MPPRECSNPRHWYRVETVTPRRSTSSKDMRSCLVGFALVALSLPALAQKSCASLPAARQAIEQGWSAYRANDIPAAVAQFNRAISLCPGEAGALTGAGYAAMRQGRLPAARAFFARAVAIDSASYDAVAGAGMAAYRAGDVKLARQSFERALRIVPHDSTALDYLARLGAPATTVVLVPHARPAVTTIPNGWLSSTTRCNAWFP